MVSLRFFFKKTSVQKHYTEIVKNGIAFMLSLTRTHSLCETEGIEFNAVIIPTDVDRSLKFLQIKQKAAGNPAAFRCFWVYKVDRFHSESVNLSCVGWPVLLASPCIISTLFGKAILVVFSSRLIFPQMQLQILPDIPHPY